MSGTKDRSSWRSAASVCTWRWVNARPLRRSSRVMSSASFATSSTMTIRAVAGSSAGSARFIIRRSRGAAATQVFPERGVSRFPVLGTSLQVDQAAGECHRHGLGAVGDAELGEDVLEMNLGRLVAPADGAGHVFVGQSAGHQFQDLEFPLAEVEEIVSLEEPGGHSSRDDPLALVRGAHRGDYVREEHVFE